MSSLSQAPTALYQGFDSFMGEVRDTAVGGKSDLTGGESTNYVSICTDSESVSQAISVSASLSDKSVDVSVDAKASWVQSLSITSTSVVVIVHTVVQKGLSQATSYSITASGAQKLTTQEFFDAYGDSFVNELVTGAEYYAAFIYNSTTTSQQEQISASLKGSAGVLSASLSTSLNDTASSTNTSILVSQQMLGASNLSYPATDPNSMVTFALDFPSQSFNAPTVLAYATTGYEHVPGITGFDAVVANRNLLGDTTFVDTSATLASLASQAAQIQRMYTGYQYTGDPGLAAKAAQIDEDLAALDALIANIEDDVTGQYTAPSLPSLGYGTPVASYTLKPALETTGGIVFYDLTATQVANGVHLLTLVVKSSGFQATYSDGTVYDHGPVSGNTVKTLSFENGDTIVEIGFQVPQMVSYEIGWLQTANGLTTGVQDGPWMFYKAPPPIIGFCGNAAPSAIALSTIAITILPTVWAQTIPTDS